MGLKLSGVQARRQRRAGRDGLLRRAPAPRALRAEGRLSRSHTHTGRSPPCNDVRFIQAAGARRGRGRPRRACARRSGPTGRCASSSAFRPAAAPMRWRAWSAQKLTPMWKPAGHRREQGRRRRRAGRRVHGHAAERRQHAADGAHQQPRAGAQPAAQAALQRRARLRADRAGRRHAQPADRQPRRSRPRR